MTTDTNRREQAELAAWRLFVLDTRDAKAAYDADMARIHALTGERWRRERDAVRERFHNDTAEARRAFDRSVEEYLASEVTA